jgi:hypothetical protein
MASSSLPQATAWCLAADILRGSVVMGIALLGADSGFGIQGALVRYHPTRVTFFRPAFVPLSFEFRVWPRRSQVTLRGVVDR